MSDQPLSLQDLRRQLDATDAALHDLLMKRGQILEGVKRHKLAGRDSIPFGEAFSPAREAQVIGRLLARHHGVLPVSLVAHIWREILSAALYWQSPFSVFVCGGDPATSLWDGARATFGAETPMSLVPSAVNVVRACAQSNAAVGVLPWPGTDASTPAWWPQLATSDQSGPRIVARLPFFQTEAERDRAPIAAVVAAAPFERSGNDSTLIVIDSATDLSRTRLLTLLKQAGLNGHVVAANGEAARNGGQQLLVQLEGHFAPDDPHISGLTDAAKDQISFVRVIGGFANPIEIPASVEASA